ncbi:capsule biosynthesis protein [Sphingomonas sp. ID0503]|uniref:capsule biosynthesis protein n=1 Tax=Sphingomonas sp. ID0503 TaxID=3399691 RepID=UPI003AFA4C01
MSFDSTGPRLISSKTGTSAPIRSGRSLPAIAADGPYAFRNRNILMLQGPVGPFFVRLAQDLRWAGANVHKINFNGGDWLFYPRGATNYRGKPEDFPVFLQRICRARRIDVIMLFGDCRPIHSSVRQVAEMLDIRVEVFEEGYVRPDYVTMETHGVNGHSALPRSPIFFLNTPAPPPAKALSVGQTIWHTGLWAFIYYFAAVLLWGLYPFYRHHRPLSWFEGLRWVRGWYRKQWYAWRNRPQFERLMADDAAPFFLVPLQVHNDAQIRVHSDFPGVKPFIEQVVKSFAAHAPPDTLLVFKHHPMDRAYCNYAQFLSGLARDHGLRGRIVYLHDEHLPSLLNKAKGVITINSTAGLSAIHHGCPTLALGDAIYRIDGLTASTTLDQFWTSADQHQIHRDLYRRFRDHLINRTQINGNFYRRLHLPGTLSGLNWSRGMDGGDEPHC